MLPIIDFTAWRGGDSEARAKIAADLGAACEDTGFFYIAGHGVPQAIVDAALNESRAFFGLTSEKKHACRRQPGHYRGYIATTPFSEDKISGEAFLYEAFILGAEVDPADPEIVASKGLYWPNRWPAETPHFKTAVQDYWQAVTNLSQDLLRACALALGQPEETLTDYFQKPLTNISLLHYPARPDRGADSAIKDSRPHYDTDVITILLPDPVGGLQVQQRDGSWREADPLPGCFLVNIGNMLELWSGGRFRSTLHRVHPPAGKGRYSIAYFAHPGYNTEIAPLPNLPIDLPADKPRRIHAGEDLAAFVALFDK